MATMRVFYSGSLGTVRGDGRRFAGKFGETCKRRTRTTHRAAADDRPSGPEGAEGAQSGSINQGSINQGSIKERLAAYGLSGVASYGLFNTLYYFVSFFVALAAFPKPEAVDTFAVALQHVFKLLAFVWAGSQVTKLPRAACALACAPLMDRLLGWITTAFRLKGGKRAAFFYVLVPFCWGLFFALLGISVLFLRY